MPDPAELAALNARLAALEHELARRRDLDEIHDVLTRYARACDWLDDALLATVFFDDAEIDYGFFKGSGAEFRPLLMSVERSANKRWHVAAQIAVDLQGDVAHVSSYQFSVSTVPGAPQPQHELMHAYGYYMDRMERRQGRWGIARRKHVALGGTLIPDLGSGGMFAVLNHVGATTPQHPDYPRTRPVAALPQR